MIIHRVEHVTGMGPIASGLMGVHNVVARSASAHGIEVLADRDSATPAEDDPDHVLPPGYIFGCETMQQLRRWFPSPYGCEAMARLGGLLVTYRVPVGRSLRGTMHVAFDKRRAVRLSVTGADEIHAGDWSGLFGGAVSSPQVEFLR